MSHSKVQIDAQFPQKLEFLFKPSRYKCAFGGRGSAKSWGFARALLITGASKKIRILCVREVQNSIKDSVHKLLKDQIELLGLTDFYTVLESSITGANGTEIIFKGLRLNELGIKSTEGIDICWAEEAEAITKSSWKTLIPTIRKPDSEIWISFNTRLDTDETYIKFVLNPPENCITVKMNYYDNPWLPQVLKDEAMHLKATNIDDYLNVWEGQPKKYFDGAVYAEEMRKARLEDRITRVPYNCQVPVSTFWDLGRRDSTAIWFAQKVGLEWHIIDYYENSRKPISHYAEIVQNRGYVYLEHWLPHDARHEQLAAEKSIEGYLKGIGWKVQITPMTTIDNGIKNLRQIFDSLWFDEVKCGDGIKCLDFYHYEDVAGNGTIKKEPVHDWSSHGADAMRYFAVALQEKIIVKKYTAPRGGWMG